MAIPKELYDLISEDEKSIPPEQIIAGLARSKNYPDIAGYVRQDLSSGMKPQDILAAMKSSYGTIESQNKSVVSDDYPEWVTPFDKSIMNFPRSLGGVISDIAKGVFAIPGAIKEGLKNTDPLAPEKAVYGMASSLVTGLIDKYGSFEKAKKVFEEDPASILSDISIFKNSFDPTRLITKPVKATTKAIAKNLPEIAYGSALKMKNKYPIEMQKKMIDEGLTRAAMPTEGGIARARKGVQDIENTVMPFVESATTPIVPKNIASRLEDVLNRDVISQGTPLKDLGVLAKKEREFLQTHPAPMSVKEAHLLKKSEYSKAKKTAYEGKGSAEVESSKAIARGAKEEVYDALAREYPQLKALELGQKEGVLINLKEALEDAVKRIGRHDVLPLKGAIGMAGQSMPLISASILELPRVKSALAIALHRANVLSNKAKPIYDVVGKLPPYAYGVGRYKKEE